MGPALLYVHPRDKGLLGDWMACWQELGGKRLRRRHHLIINAWMLVHSDSPTHFNRVTLSVGEWRGIDFIQLCIWLVVIQQNQIKPIFWLHEATLCIRHQQILGQIWRTSWWEARNAPLSSSPSSDSSSPLSYSPMSSFDNQNQMLMTARQRVAFQPHPLHRQSMPLIMVVSGCLWLLTFELPLNMHWLAHCVSNVIGSNNLPVRCIYAYL